MGNVMSWVEQWAQFEVIRTYVGLGLLGVAAIITLCELVATICTHFRDRPKRKDKKDKSK